MKKTLALVLALAMVFSTITVAFAEETLGADAQICADLGMLKGETGTVDAAYVATTPTRLQAAVMFLRLKGLEAEALAFTGEENFADGNIAWAEGANLLAYLKANPQLGWVGDGVNFNPSAPISAKEYYKVLLETLGYKQTTTEVVGDFTWENVIEFAATVGLSKVADVANFTVNDLAVATVEALKINVKDTEKTLLATLVEAGKITEEAAVATGLMEGGAQGGALAAEIDKVYAVGNAVVQVEFVDPVDEAAATNLANYSIEGLAINAVTYVPAARANGDDRVILDTAAQTAGKLYTLTIGEKTAQFSGLAKLSDGPEIEANDGVVSEDVEEVVVNFDRNIDYATGTDVANYSISGVTIVKAEVDRDEVTLTTEGLKDGSKYTLKCSNIKSVDLVNRKTTSDDFKVDYDTAAPKLLSSVPDSNPSKVAPYADTNTRVIVYFDEEVDEATAEDIANYSIKVNETDGAALEILSIEWDGDDENNVEITTEPMDKREEYKITVSGIADQCKVPNVMAKATSKTFDSVAADKDEPSFDKVQVISPTKFLFTFKDDSRLDSASVLDKSNYSFECNDVDLDIEDISEYDSDTGFFTALFTVEEMETDEQCKLTYVDILDEYGNAMDEDTKSFTADTDYFTSAKLTKIEAEDKNTVILFFANGATDAPLDADSAENIANYSIDGGIGIPTDAEFEADGYVANTVKLTVNDLIGNYGYTLTVDGLKDVAGNELSIVEKDFAADKTTWGDPVELDDADATSRYVVELSFDQEIDYAAGAYVVVRPDGATTAANDVKLFAGRTTDDDQGIEFASFTGNANTNKYLTDGVTYNVYEVYNVTKMDGTAFTLGSDKVSFQGTNEEPAYSEFENYEQVDAKTFKVVMSDYVRLAAGVRQQTLDVNDEDNDGKTDEVLDEYALVNLKDSKGNNVPFRVTVDSGDFIDETVFFQLVGTPTTQLVEDEEYKANLYSLLVDELNIPAGDDDDADTGKVNTAGDYLVPNVGSTVFEGDEKDSDAPSIDEVVAKDRWVIEVTFDENIDVNNFNANDFELWNNDLDEKVNILSIEADDTYNCNMLVITLNNSSPLEGRYEYELRMDKNAVQDYAGNNVTDDTFTFDGSYLAQHE